MTSTGQRAPRNASLIARIAMRVEVDKASGCWNWVGALSDQGYGRVRVGARTRYAHRVAWEQYFLAVPEGLQLDHLCRNRACCNPVHLEPVTGLMNIQRGVQARRALKQARPRKPMPKLEACTTWDLRLKHLSADLRESHFNGLRGRALCGSRAYSEGVFSGIGQDAIAALPECKRCANRVARWTAEAVTM